MTPADLRALSDAATPHLHIPLLHTGSVSARPSPAAMPQPYPAAITTADAAFIATARNLLPLLVDLWEAAAARSDVRAILIALEETKG